MGKLDGHSAHMKNKPGGHRPHDFSKNCILAHRDAEFLAVRSESLGF